MLHIIETTIAGSKIGLLERCSDCSEVEFKERLSKLTYKDEEDAEVAAKSQLIAVFPAGSSRSQVTEMIAELPDQLNGRPIRRRSLADAEEIVVQIDIRVHRLVKQKQGPEMPDVWPMFMRTTFSFSGESLHDIDVKLDGLYL